MPKKLRLHFDTVARLSTTREPGRGEHGVAFYSMGLTQCHTECRCPITYRGDANGKQ